MRAPSGQTAYSDVKSMFFAVEQAGLRLAIKGRLVAILVLGIWMVITRPPERSFDIIFAMVVLAIFGLLHFAIIGSVWDRKWVKYAFLTVDYILISGAMTIFPPEPSFDLPQFFTFRFDVFHYYYIVLAVAAFSFSPGLVLWAGAIGAAGWMTAFLWVRSKVATPLEWGDAIQSTSTDQFLSVFLSDRFVGTGSRVQEALIYLVVACLIALVMQRARQTVHRQFDAERDRNTVSQIFGQFVPASIADTMIKDRGMLDPVERDATILFVDIAGFTQLTENRGPKATVDILNAYFDATTDVIGKHDGVVTQFQGDAILAVFNVPIANHDHAKSAFDAACDILDSVGKTTFAGETLSVRIGINSGPVIAGNVGGGGRQSYTVHGDTVNLAARLEAMNKDYNTPLLLTEATASLLPDTRLVPMGEVAVRGHSTKVAIFSLPV
ncbi:adenylate/guanylate cyclase domain-containing protein [Thalassospira sp. HJ]|uniref:adenylate/guanylate cyclase domain-containing protein n=1 Tax=Thalassospira sp. HJ TaxID=1616823 RepID=UPI0009E37551|nr:adenylate/guanylate cyclase domain-containing protein [Thalassospira sp. HJ]